MNNKIALRIISTVIALAMISTLAKFHDSRAASRVGSNLPPGGLDPTFDLDGKVTTQIGSGNDLAQAIVIQPDGKIVAAGLSRSATASATTALARYNSDGSLDTTFGGDGIVTTPYGTHSRAFAVAVQADGKIVAGGDSGSPSAVFRYNSDGSLDTTFDGDGVLLITFLEGGVIEAVAIQADQKIVVAGWGEGPFFRKTDNDVRSTSLAPQNHTTDFALARLNPDGSLDTSFGVGGKVLTAITMGEQAKAVAIQTDGKIIAAGWTADFESGAIALVRYNIDGSLDTAFGSGGKVITGFGGKYSYGGAEAIALQPDGRIVATGYYGGETDLGWAIVRYNTNGSLDTSFDGDGKVTIPRTVDSLLNGVAIQSNGKIIASGGNVEITSANDFFVLRFNANGASDTSFDDDGMLTTDFFGNDDVPEAVALQPDGRIVVAGTAHNGANYDSALARYIGDSVIPHYTPFDFDGDGRADVSVFRPSDGVWYLDRSTLGFSATHFGLPTDKITPADLDGDGKTDVAVYRDGVWYWLNSSTVSFNTRQFGSAGDIPVPSDYTGDGRAELAVYRAGVWYSLNLANEQLGVRYFGIPGDKPVPADYDGDGNIDEAVYRNGEWHLNRSTEGYLVIRFGLPADLPVVGDYDGDGRVDVAVYRNGTWYLSRSTEGFTTFQFGLATDIPSPADFDGDGRTDAAIYRGGSWWIMQSGNGAIHASQFGLANDSPVPSAFVSQ